MTPNAKTKHNPHCAPALLDALKDAGISNASAAELVGVHRNHLANLKKGVRNGKPVVISYPDQFTLECLLEAAQSLKKPD